MEQTPGHHDDRSRPRGWKKEYTELLGYSTVGIEMGAAVGIGVTIGWLCDRHFQWTSPWLTILFLALGLIAAGKAFYRAAKDLRAKQEKLNGGRHDDSGLG